MSLSEAVLTERRPLWSAMSDLFLDTEVRWLVPGVAATCARSGSDQAELDRIFWREVFPLAIDNMTQLAGEWASLDLDPGALARRAQQGVEASASKLAFAWMVRSEWHVTLSLVARLRAEPPTRWPTLVRVWEIFCRLYLDPPAGDPTATAQGTTSLPSARVDDGEDVDLAEEWRQFEPLARAMLIGDETRTTVERAAVVHRWTADRVGSRAP